MGMCCLLTRPSDGNSRDPQKVIVSFSISDEQKTDFKFNYVVLLI